MTLFIFILANVVFTRGITTLLFLNQSLTWLKSKTKIAKKAWRVKRPNVYIILAVLREQAKIVDTLDYFVKYFKSVNTKLLVVTSQREFEKKFTGPSTQEIVRNYIKGKRLSSFVELIDYPHKNGVKAHQVNYALDFIKDKSSYVAIYDADSRPHPETLNKVCEEIGNNPETKVLLQSAIFVKNYDSYSDKSFLTRFFLKASSLLQTRWTLVHELPRLLRQSFQTNRFFKKYSYAHVVGHGMFIQIELFKSLGGFPTGTITEDLFLGYLLRSKGISICPLPLLEVADSPITIKGLWNQKYVWFWGPMQTFTYLRYTLTNSKKIGVLDLKVPFVLTLQGIVSAIAWLTSGPIVVILLLSPFLVGTTSVVLFSYLAVFLYGPLQYFWIEAEFHNLLILAGATHRKLQMHEKFLVSVFSLPAIVFNSVPPYFSLMAELKSIKQKTRIYKPKTDD